MRLLSDAYMTPDEFSRDANKGGLDALGLAIAHVLHQKMGRSISKTRCTNAASAILSSVTEGVASFVENLPDSEPGSNQDAHRFNLIMREIGEFIKDQQEYDENDKIVADIK